MTKNQTDELSLSELIKRSADRPEEARQELVQSMIDIEARYQSRTEAGVALRIRASGEATRPCGSGRRSLEMSLCTTVGFDLAQRTLDIGVLPQKIETVGDYSFDRRSESNHYHNQELMVGSPASYRAASA
jgi:hypothetical protein